MALYNSDYSKDSVKIMEQDEKKKAEDHITNVTVIKSQMTVAWSLVDFPRKIIDSVTTNPLCTAGHIMKTLNYLSS